MNVLKDSIMVAFKFRFLISSNDKMEAVIIIRFEFFRELSMISWKISAG